MHGRLHPCGCHFTGCLAHPVFSDVDSSCELNDLAHDFAVF